MSARPAVSPVRTPPVGLSSALRWGGVLAVAALAVVAHYRVFGFGFIWDDPIVFEQLRSMESWRDVLFPPPIVPKFYYRPLIFATFLVDRGLGGGSPFWFHATVIFAHAIASGLVLLVAFRLLGPDRVAEAWLAAALFAVHPVHVESVAWIAGRSDVIATVLVLITLLFAVRTGRAWTAWAAGGVFLLALLAKEVAAAALVLVVSRDVLLERRAYWGRYLPLVIALSLYFLLRRWALGTFAGGYPTGSDGLDLLRDLLAATGWYAGKFVWPLDLNAYVPEVPPGGALPILGGLSLVAAAFVSVRGWRAGRPEVALLCLWYFVTLAPSLGVAVRRSASAVLAERYLYLPSVAAVILVGFALAALRSRPMWWRGTCGLLAALCLAMAVQTLRRSEVWRDDLAFWSDVAKKSSAFSLPHRELADAYVRRNLLDEAEREYRQALTSKSDVEGLVMTYNNLGNLYLRRNELDAAAQTFDAGLKLHVHPYLWNGSARLAMRRAEEAQKRGDSKEVVRQVYLARDALERALAADPADYKSHALLGQVLLSLGDRAGAREHLETAVRIEPNGGIAETSRRFLERLGP